MNIVAMVLAGGEGTRLYPLTAEHAKPAVPFASGYRMVDFVLSNLVNSRHLDHLRAGAVQARIADEAHRRGLGAVVRRRRRHHQGRCCRAPIPWAASSRAPPTRSTSTSTCCRRIRPTWWRCSPPTTSTAWTCAR